ncbi:MAG: hypothetical protein L3K16_03970 [Thermoplasmata archaeon]|nr:hypothetical protein [Thermoplasmata archaeon]
MPSPVPMPAARAFQLIAHLATFSANFVLRGTGAHAKTVVNWVTSANHARAASVARS